MARRWLGVLVLGIILKGDARVRASWLEHLRQLDAVGARPGISSYVLDSVTATKMQHPDGAVSYEVRVSYLNLSGHGDSRGFVYDERDLAGTITAGGVVQQGTLSTAEHDRLRATTIGPREADQRAWGAAPAVAFRAGRTGPYATRLRLIADDQNLPTAIRVNRVAWEVIYQRVGGTNDDRIVIWVDAMTGAGLGQSKILDLGSFQPIK